MKQFCLAWQGVDVWSWGCGEIHTLDYGKWLIKVWCEQDDLQVNDEGTASFQMTYGKPIHYLEIFEVPDNVAYELDRQVIPSEKKR